MPDEYSDLIRGVVGSDPSERVRRIGRTAQIPDDITEDYLKTTKIESGHNINVRPSSAGALGFGQVMPDRPGGTTRTIQGRTYNLKNPDENIEAGLRYFAEGGNDPVGRRLYYFGGPRARATYQRTGRIPNISDSNMTAAQYVKATGGLQSAQQTPDDEYSKLIRDTVGRPETTPKVETSQPKTSQLPRPRQPQIRPRAAASLVPGLGGISQIRQPRQKPQVSQRPFAGNPLIPVDRSQIGPQTEKQAIQKQVGEEMGSTLGNLTYPILHPINALTKSREQVFNEEVDQRIAAQKRANTPEMVAARKRIGAVPEQVPLTPYLPSPRGVASAVQRTAGGLVKGAAGIVDPNGVPGLAGILQTAGVPMDKARDWLNARGNVLQESASMPMTPEGKAIERQLPEKATDAVAGLGLSVGQLIITKKATGLNLGQLMALESWMQNSDLKPAERATRAAQDGIMGKVLDQHLSRPASALAFSAPTAVQSGIQVAQGQKSLEDAILETGVQAGAGFALGGKPSEVPARLRAAEGIQTKVPDIQGILADREAKVSPFAQPADVARRVALREGGTVPPATLPQTPTDIQPVLRGKPTPRRGERPTVPSENVSEQPGVGITSASGDLMAANAKIEAIQRRIQEVGQIKQPGPRAAGLRARLEQQLADAIDERNGLLDPKVQARLEGRSVADVLAERRTGQTQGVAEQTNVGQEAPRPLSPADTGTVGQVAEAVPQEAQQAQIASQPATEPNTPPQPATPVATTTPPLPPTTPTTGIAHRVETQARGEEPVRGESIGAAESVQRGRDLLSKSDDPGRLVANTISAFDRTGAVSPESMAVVRAQHEQLAQEANRAFDSGGMNSPEFKAAEQARRDFYDNAVKPMQTAWSNTGRAQQGETAIDTGTFYGLFRAFRDTNGREMSPREQVTAENLSKKSAAADEVLKSTQQRLVDTLNSLCPR